MRRDQNKTKHSSYQTEEFDKSSKLIETCFLLLTFAFFPGALLRNV